MIKIYTDGSCLSNPGKGGWAGIILINNKKIEISGAKKDTTNNQMELLAPIESLKKIPKGSKVEIFTDSKYVKLGITEWINKWKKNNWKTSNKKKVKNIDLWKKLDDLIPKNFRNGSKYKRTGKAGIFAGSLELVKEGNLTMKQDKLFDDIYVKENND